MSVPGEPFYQDPYFWVAASFVGFIVLAAKPVARSVANMLDQRSARIAAELAEARRLREEAEALLAAYQKKQRESLQEAEAMLATTKADAARIMERAEADLKTALDKRMQQAQDKIAQAESRALGDVESHVVDIALSAARILIAEHLKNGSNNEALVKQAAADLARKLH